MHTALFGGMGNSWLAAGSLLSLAFWIGVIVLAVWFYRFVKDSAENKRLLAWGLGLVIGVSLLASLSFWGMGGMMGGKSWGGMMMGSMMNDPEFRQDMHEMMDEAIGDYDTHHTNNTTN